ncbi:MAG: hypothetical protein LBU23_09165 [Planctomycetota bacterium]|nr:hypothetical protein [Planctomycetota bacterium]
MRTWLMSLAVVCCAGGSALGIDLCNPRPPKEKWVEVCETVKIEVPVTEYVDEPCEIQVTRMERVETEVEVCEGKWVYETQTVDCLKWVTECEEYTVNKTRYEKRPETRVRQVPKTICENVEKTVTKRISEDVCDPATGKISKVWREVCETVTVPVNKTIMVDEEYTVMVKCPVTVPITKIRKVKKQVPATKEVRVKKFVQTPVLKKVVTMKPVVETKTVMKKRAVCTTKTVEKQVVKKVKVPVEPDC